MIIFNLIYTVKFIILINSIINKITGLVNASYNNNIRYNINRN